MFGQIIIRGCALVYFLLGAMMYVNGWWVIHWHGLCPPAAMAMVVALLFVLASDGLWFGKRGAPAVAVVAWLVPPLLYTLMSFERSHSLDVMAQIAVPDELPGPLLWTTPLVVLVLWYARRRFRALDKPADSQVVPPVAPTDPTGQALGKPPESSMVLPLPLWRRGLVGVALCGVALLPAWRMRPAPTQLIIRESSAAGVRPVRILFIGNSQTYVNDMPTMLMALGAADQRPVSTGMIVGGGYTLHMHAAQAVVSEVLAQHGPWDFVVLQEQSTTPFWFPGESYRSLQSLVPLIRRAGAEAVLLNTGSGDDWERVYRDKTFAAAERALAVPVVPANAVRNRVSWRLPDLKLLYADGHSTPAGSYVIACTLYAALLKRNPEGLPATLYAPAGQLLVDLPPEQLMAKLGAPTALPAGQLLVDLLADEARQIQALAWQVVQGRQQNEVPFLDADAGLLVFYESPFEGTPVATRTYRNRFKKSETRYVVWELQLDFLPRSQRRDFMIEATYYRADGTDFATQSLPAHLEPASFYSMHNYGWGSKEPGTWPVGSYRVELRIEDKKVASRSFEVYQD